MARWPHLDAIRDAMHHVATEEQWNQVTPLGRAALFDRQVINAAIAACLIINANDIPDPRQTHRGPWTPGWTPM